MTFFSGLVVVRGQSLSPRMEVEDVVLCDYNNTDYTGCVEFLNFCRRTVRPKCWVLIYWLVGALKFLVPTIMTRWEPVS